MCRYGFKPHEFIIDIIPVRVLVFEKLVEIGAVVYLETVYAKFRKLHYKHIHRLRFCIYVYFQKIHTSSRFIPFLLFCLIFAEIAIG